MVSNKSDGQIYNKNGDQLYLFRFYRPDGFIHNEKWMTEKDAKKLSFRNKFSCKLLTKTR